MKLIVATVNVSTIAFTRTYTEYANFQQTVSALIKVIDNSPTPHPEGKLSDSL